MNISIPRVLGPRDRLAAVLLPALFFCWSSITLAVEFDDTAELANLSLEELLNMEITTLSRKAEFLGDAPAAVFVISKTDIQRSGARSIPDLLRMVPGMQVAQIDSNKWAVTARGANGRYANKLLVLMDGRSLYSPLLSGVYWDVQDTDLATIERIEVIRGPGATMWGANAVNGVVNIITSNAADTQGGDLRFSASDRDSVEGVFRYGGEIGNGAYRVFAKAIDRGGNGDLSGQASGDSWDMLRFGGRADWTRGSNDTFSISAEVYDGAMGGSRINRSIAPPYETVDDTRAEVSGAFARLNWSHDVGADSNLAIRGYLSTTDRQAATFGEKRDTLDIEMQYRFGAGEIHDVMWGVDYRYSDDQTTDSFEVRFDRPGFTNRRLSGFIQDDITLMDGRLRIVVGTKFENNNFVEKDLEVSPSARFAYHLNSENTVWGAVSRAIRVPSRGERDGAVVNVILPPGQPALPLPVPIAVGIQGNPNLVSEEILAYELGYRFKTDDLYIDTAIFFNEYGKLRSATPQQPICQPSGDSLLTNPACLIGSTHVDNFYLLVNGHATKTMGVEAWVSKHLSESWQLQLGYTWYDTRESVSDNALNLEFEEDSPDHQLSLRSSLELPYDVNLNLWLRHVAELKSQRIDAYTALDLRLAWSPTASLEIAMSGRNLIEGAHQEFVSELSDLVPIVIEPEGYLEISWGF